MNRNNKEDEVEDPEHSIRQAIVADKYSSAGEVANHVLKAVIEKCVDGASVRELCKFADELIITECSTKYKKDKEMKRGISFPTCISVNNCVCHFSPIGTEPDYILKNEDMVKIDLGAHLDGYIAVVAHTIVVGATPESKITGRKADVILAAYHSCQAALRLLKPKTDSDIITDTVMKVCQEFNCKPVEGMLSHQLMQFKIDGKKTIIQNPTEAQRKEYEKCELGEYEVYAMDVLVSTGSGTAREQDTRVSVFKKTEETYQLKLKAAKNFYAEVGKKYGVMAFNLRDFDDETKAKMGVYECVNHKLLSPFQVLYEKPGEYVSQFKFTVFVLPKGMSKVTGLTLDESAYESEHSIKDPKLKQLLATSLKHKGGGKKKKTKNAQLEGNGVLVGSEIDGEEKMEVDG